MKLRQAEKIINRVHTEGRRNQWYGTPLSKSWRKLASKMHKAQAVVNHHSPFGRMANEWANKHVPKMCKEMRAPSNNAQ